MKKNEPIRILNIVPNMRAAGIETFVMNVYRNIDRSKIQFDFIVHNQKKEFYDDEIEKLGGKIYRFTYKDDKNLLKYIKDLNSFFKIHKEYKIIHGHMQSMMPLYLYIAKKHKVPIRIAHAHNGSYEKTLKGFILHLFSRFSKYFANHYVACSNVAGRYLFGKRKFEIIYNGIDIDKFLFNQNIRNEVRKNFNIEENDFVIGHIGRFELQKNHKFLIDMFDDFYKQVPSSKLILIGEGKLREKIEKKVKELGIEKHVLFLGIRNHINELYQAMDCFVLPSLYEGLPVVGVEAQISGLYCLFSEKITNELKISENCKFLNINNTDDWIAEIKKINLNENRKEAKTNFDSYNINNIAKNLQEKYLIYEKNN